MANVALRQSKPLRKVNSPWEESKNLIFWLGDANRTHAIIVEAQIDFFQMMQIVGLVDLVCRVNGD